VQFLRFWEKYPRLMDSLFAFAAPLALMLPLAAGAVEAPEGKAGGAPAASAPQCDAAGMGEPPRVNPLSAYRSTATAQQVRIQQRVIIRIAPLPPAERDEMLAELPQRGSSYRLEERAKTKCVALQDIAWVETGIGSGNRLVLVMRDRRLVSVNLEKSCRARDFYSGFYVDKSKDGRICIDRDQLRSRTGASCDVEAIYQLVEVRG
jgi:hypothetical protein